MKILKYLLSITIFFSLRAEDGMTVPFSSIEKGVSAIAAGCVNVVTGDYVESVQDVSVAGPMPLTLDRMYTACNDVYTLHYGWMHNHASFLGFDKDYDKVNFLDKSRGTLQLDYRGFDMNGYVDTEVYTFSRDNIKKGYTNCLSGQISARTNAEWIRLHYPITVQTHSKTKEVIKKDYPEHVTMQMPSGNQLIFYKKALNYYLLLQDKLPNGKNRIVYGHDGDGNVMTINFENDRRKFSSINIVKQVRTDHEGRSFFDVVASDGKFVKYYLEKYKNRTEEDKENYKPSFYHITEVRSPQFPTIQYEYKCRYNTKDKELVSGSYLPEGRGKKIDYYSFCEEDQYKRTDKVRYIQEPSGPKGEYVPTYQFVYKNKNSTFVKDGFNHLKSYGIDDSGRICKVKYYYGTHDKITEDAKVAFEEQFNWDSKGRITSQKIIDGLWIRAAKYFQYDKKGNITTEKTFANFSGFAKPIKIGDTFPGGLVKKFAYDESNLLVKEEDNTGKSTTYTYHPDSDLVSSKVINNQIRYSYEYDDDACLTMISVEEPGVEKRITRISPRPIAPFGLPLEVQELYCDKQTGQECLLKRVHNEHNAEGLLLSEDHYDAQGDFCYRLEWNYDSHGNVLREKNALGEWTERDYDANDNLIYQRGPRPDVERRFTYDLMNRLTQEEVTWKGKTYTTKHRYDIMGQKTSTTDWEGNTTEFEYDEFGHVVETRKTESRTYQKYDILGNIIAIIDARGFKTKMSYNAYGKRARIDYPDGTSELNVYNLDGTLKRSIARTGLKTLYTYDTFGRVIQEETSYGIQTYTYDAFHLKSKTDLMGVTIYYEYDGAGRLIQESKAGITICNEYDSLGRLHKVKDDHVVNIKAYDFLDRVIEERTEDHEGNIYKTTRYAYDGDGNRIMEQIGESCTYTEYDPFGRPVKVTDPLGNITHYNYRKHEETIVDSLGNQTIIHKNWMNKEETVTKRNCFGELQSKVQYEYDPCGNCVKRLETIIAPHADNRAVETTWTYDAMGEVLTLVEAGSKETEYVYNKQGLLKTLIKPDKTKIHYEYDEKGRLTRQYSDNLDYEYEYDANDNPIRSGNTTREYNEHGWLTTETLETGYTTHYDYDTVGRLNRLTLSDDSLIEYRFKGPYLKEVVRNDYIYSYSIRFSRKIAASDPPHKCG